MWDKEGKQVNVGYIIQQVAPGKLEPNCTEEMRDTV